MRAIGKQRDEANGPTEPTKSATASSIGEFRNPRISRTVLLRVSHNTNVIYSRYVYPVQGKSYIHGGRLSLPRNRIPRGMLRERGTNRCRLCSVRTSLCTGCSESVNVSKRDRTATQQQSAKRGLSAVEEKTRFPPAGFHFHVTGDQRRNRNWKNPATTLDQLQGQ